jgi:hypothetical protein
MIRSATGLEADAEGRVSARIRAAISGGGGPRRSGAGRRRCALYS